MNIPLQEQFRVRAHQIPDDTIVVEPGLLADGDNIRAIDATRLTIAVNSSPSRRIDRVVLDRELGKPLVLTGGDLAPALGTDQLALARIVVEPAASLIVLDAAIVDERVLWARANPVIASSGGHATFIRRRATTFDEHVKIDGLHKVLFGAAGAAGSITSGAGFLEDASTFVVQNAGYYQVSFALGVVGGTASKVRIHTQLNPEAEAQRTFSNAFTTVPGTNPMAVVSDILELRAGERILFYGLEGPLIAQQKANAGADISFMTIQLLALK